MDRSHIKEERRTQGKMKPYKTEYEERQKKFSTQSRRESRKRREQSRWAS